MTNELNGNPASWQCSCGANSDSWDELIKHLRGHSK